MWWMLLLACATPPPRSVLLVTIDTLRADHLGSYGYARARTPRLDAFAAEGVRLADHGTTAPLTLPAHTSLMTGLLPPAHGVRDNGNFVVPPAAATLAEHLHAAGFETHAFVSAAVLDSRYGLDQGFDTYDDDLWSEDDPAMFMIRDRPAARTTDRALAWLQEWGQREQRTPFFTWIHYFDPHEPHEAPVVDRLATTSGYDAEIAATDRAVGRLLDGLAEAGVADDTLVIVTSDHGESLNQHGENTHGIFVYDATMHIPFLMRGRGLPAGTVVSTPTSAVDVVPTVLALLGLPGMPTQGTDLRPLLRGETSSPRPQYFESMLAELGFGMAPLQAVRVGADKWIRAPRPERYDLSLDRAELHDRAGEDPSVDARLDAALQALLDDSAGRALPALAATMDDQTTDMLRALGYLPAADDPSGMGGIDPKDGLPLYEALSKARHLAQRKRWPEAEATLRDLLIRAPANVSARNVLAIVLLRQGKTAEARAEYEQSLVTLPDQERAYLALAQIAAVSGDPEGARVLYDRALALSPGFIEAMVQRAALEMAQGRTEEAGSWIQRATARDAEAPVAAHAWADFLFLKADYAEARGWYERVLAKIPSHYVALLQAGLSAQRSGDAAAAEAYFVRADQLQEGDWKPTYNRACLRAQAGDAGAAFGLLAEAARLGLPPGVAAADTDLASLRADPRWSDYRR